LYCPEITKYSVFVFLSRYREWITSIQFAAGAFILASESPHAVKWVMQLQHEANQSLPVDSKCKNAWSFTSILTCFTGVVV
jgi:hypothetical protein